MNALTTEQVEERLIDHPSWRLEDVWLARDLQFADFEAAWQFMSHVAHELPSSFEVSKLEISGQPNML